MNEGAPAFAIDDGKTVDANLATLAAELKKLDPALGAVLSPKLADFSRGKPLDRGALLNALFAATATVTETAPPASPEIDP